MSSFQTSSDIKTQFHNALFDSKVCLHPTDSVPGLTFDPEDETALERLAVIKNRVGPAKPFVGLVGSTSQALSCFAALPILPS